VVAWHSVKLCRKVKVHKDHNDIVNITKEIKCLNLKCKIKLYYETIFFLCTFKLHEFNLFVQGQRKSDWWARAGVADAAFSSWFHYTRDSA
jgi:hypothetical protein